MNEQIQKLISEAVKAIPDHVDFDLPKEFTEKFAELLVRECITIARQEECWAPQQGPVEIKIKEYFGVEE